MNLKRIWRRSYLRRLDLLDAVCKLTGLVGLAIWAVFCLIMLPSGKEVMAQMNETIPMWQVVLLLSAICWLFMGLIGIGYYGKRVVEPRLVDLITKCHGLRRIKRLTLAKQG